MSTKTETVKPKIVKTYELDDYEKLLKGIEVAACMISESHQIVDEASVLRRLNALTLNGPSDGNCCSCCGVGPFETRVQQTAHYKHHWHTHNLKRKLFGKPALTLGQFNSKQEDSSVSGSDSETEDNNSTNPAADLFAAATRHCKAFFTNQKGQVFCIYRCILHHRKEALSSDGEGDAWIERCKRLAIPGFQRWAILMISGGHFAGAIFSGGVPVLHKTHHSYTTRRGQGHAQATRDNHAAHAPRSAGASLRRYNTAQFLEHVQGIISSWSRDLAGCSLVLYRAVGAMNQGALFGKTSPLTRDDPRVRQLPFPTRKPTFKEVKRVHDTVASVEVYDSMELFQKALIGLTTKPSKSNTDLNAEKNKKSKPSPGKPDRAKSRERTPRELPTQTMSSEDEGPCYIDSETPVDWIKILSEQARSKRISNSRKDLLHVSTTTSEFSEEDEKPEIQLKEVVLKKKKKKPVEKKDELQEVKDEPKEKKDEPKEKEKKDEPKEKEKKDEPKEKDKKDEPKEKEKKNDPKAKKGSSKIPANLKKMWSAISSAESCTLATIREEFSESSLAEACNAADPRDGNTALHKAAIAERPDLVTELLSLGCDPCARNHLLQTPYAASPHSDTRIAFRLFQAQFPHKYNYAKSQIPGPVTPEQLELEKQKKSQQKRAKRQREKEKQNEKQKMNKFLIMTDAEKVKLNEPRCFLCGVQLPKKPFEYEKFKFCSIKCLQNHRNLRPLHKSAYTYEGMPLPRLCQT